MLRIGEIIQTSIWLDGNETKEMRKQFEEEAQWILEYQCNLEGLSAGPIRCYEKHPEDSDVPPVPKHINGERIRLLQIEADIIQMKPITSKGSFIADLDIKDLKLLRKITRRSVKVHLSDEDCDSIIEELGPEAAMDAVRRNYKKELH